MLKPSNPVFSWLSENWANVLVLAGFLAIILFVGVYGEFPLNDDWVYARSVKHLADTGEFSIVGSVAANIIPIYLAAAVVKLVGFSHTLLRVLLLITGLIGYWGLYLSLRELGVTKRDSALLSAVFLFNPFIVNLCFGFMTDIPALALNNWFIYFALRALKNGGLKYWLACGLLFLSSLYSRQTVLVFIPACVVLVILSFCMGRRYLLPAFLLLILPAALSFIVEPLLLASSKNTVGYVGYKNIFSEELHNLISVPTLSWPLVIDQFAMMMAYLGLFSLPLLPVALIACGRNLKQQWLSLSISLFVSLSLIGFPLWQMIFVKQRLMPYSENLFAPPRVGPYSIISGAQPTWGTSSKFYLSLVAALGAVMLGCFIVFATIKTYRFARNLILEKRLAAEPVQYASLFLVVSLLFALPFLAVQTRVLNLDRYYLLVLPPILLLVGCYWQNIRWRWLGLCLLPGLIVFGIYSALSAQDYLNFSRARWAAIHWLEDQGISSRRIDGGPEYNCNKHGSLADGFRINESFIGWTFDYRGGFPRNRWRWWPIVSEDYIVAGSPLEGYETVRKFPYWSALKQRPRDLYVLIDKKLQTP
ncbi:MAG: glycosyltransferase family 39 protein [Candidatus Obscuribacterales bacterium]|nr:glycosyltransferase family 39 protein [Candidatus Obscuribacterales bacterium]